MLTQERADALSEFLTEDSERMERVMGMTPEEALAEINENGYDFTLDELNEFSQALKNSGFEGELDADSLDNVAGGISGLAHLFVNKTVLLGMTSRFINRTTW